MSKLIFCKFLDAEGKPRGREYTYKSDIDVKEGDLVLVEVVRNSSAPTEQKVMVTKTDLSPADIPGYENFKNAVKTIIGLAPAETTAEDPAAEGENVSEDVPEIDMGDL